MTWYESKILVLGGIILGIVILGWFASRWSTSRVWRVDRGLIGSRENTGVDAPEVTFELPEPENYNASDLRPSEHTPLLRGSAVSSVTAVGSSTAATPIAVGSRRRERGYYPSSHISPDSTPSSGSLDRGVFHKARNFVLNDAIIVKYDQIASKEAVLKWISEYTISGAEFDSSARDPPPQCHPGTRLHVLEMIQGWIHNRHRKHRLLWLSGPAGVGKSAIIQSIAQSTASMDILGATLFFSKINNRNNPNLVFTTLAYQLGVRIPQYRRYLRKKMERDYRMLEKGMKELFELLFVAPLAHLQGGTEYAKWVIMLDGLDECQGDRAQVEIIHLISNFALKYPNSPLIWIISSRPEPHIKDTFNSKGVKPSRWAYFLPVDSDDACRDVELYLSHAFARIRAKYPYITAPWPTEEQFTRIANLASGLFVFAVTLAQFIDDPNVGDPITHLNLVLDLSTNPIQDPLEALHALYGRILDNVPSQTLPSTKLLLGFCLVRGEFVGLEDSTFQLSCNVLGLPHHVAWAALNKLHSVVQVPIPHFADASGFSFYHASFGDFLRDEWRSGKYAVDLDGVHRHVLERCFQILQDIDSEGATNPSAFNVSLGWPRIDRESNTRLKGKLIQKAWANLVSQVLFTCSLQNSPVASDVEDMLWKFKGLDFSRIIASYMDLDAASSSEEFANWVLRAELPEEVQQSGLIERTTLQFLDLSCIDTQKVSLAFHYQDTQVDFVCNGDTVSDMKEYFPTSFRVDDRLVAEVAELKAQRLSQLDAELPVPDAPVVIIGDKRASKACAIVYTSDSNWKERSLFFLPHR